MPTYPSRPPRFRPQRTSRPANEHDLAQLTTAIDAEARELLRRCDDINEALTEALERWNPFVEESENNYLDPAAEMIPYDSIPDLRDLATRTLALQGQLAQLVVLIAQERQGRPAH